MRHERKAIIMMKNKREYEPPKAVIYRFDDNDRILTASGTPQQETKDYAAYALNRYMGGNNTTIE